MLVNLNVRGVKACQHFEENYFDTGMALLKKCCMNLMAIKTLSLKTLWTTVYSYQPSVETWWWNKMISSHNKVHHWSVILRPTEGSVALIELNNEKERKNPIHVKVILLSVQRVFMFNNSFDEALVLVTSVLNHKSSPHPVKVTEWMDWM